VPFILTTIMAAGLAALSAPPLLCAGLAGLAVFLALRHPAGQLHRMTHRNSRLAEATAPLVRLFRGRRDAPPLSRRVLLSVACALAIGLATTRIDLAGGWIWFALPVIAACGTVVIGWLEPRATRRRRSRLIMEVPQALELMAAGLAAGLPARMACAAVVEAFDGPVADDLGQVLSLLELGVGDVESWRAIRDHPQLGLAALDLARSVESGTSMVEGLRHHAAAAREARRGALQVSARAVGVRSVLPMMACFIPSFMLLGIVPAVVSAIFNAFA
jgi:pilus assembly protein TadC